MPYSTSCKRQGGSGMLHLPGLIWANRLKADARELRGGRTPYWVLLVHNPREKEVPNDNERHC
jgi:hypothetical protein